MARTDQPDLGLAGPGMCCLRRRRAGTGCVDGTRGDDRIRPAGDAAELLGPPAGRRAGDRGTGSLRCHPARADGRSLLFSTARVRATGAELKGSSRPVRKRRSWDASRSWTSPGGSSSRTSSSRRPRRRRRHGLSSWIRQTVPEVCCRSLTPGSRIDLIAATQAGRAAGGRGVDRSEDARFAGKGLGAPSSVARSRWRSRTWRSAGKDLGTPPRRESSPSA